MKPIRRVDIHFHSNYTARSVPIYLIDYVVVPAKLFAVFLILAAAYLVVFPPLVVTTLLGAVFESIMERVLALRIRFRDLMAGFRAMTTIRPKIERRNLIFQDHQPLSQRKQPEPTSKADLDQLQNELTRY